MTLKRTLEPEVMDSTQEAQEYNDMDHSEVNRLFVSDLIQFAQQRTDSEISVADDETMLGDVLDMGTGTALIPVELCRRNFQCRVMAIDMAVSMLDLAVYNVEAAGLGDRITLSQIDAKKMPYEDQMFDVVMSNSIIHHIPDPLECLREMSRVTRAGGILFVRDLMRPDDVQAVNKLVDTYAREETEYSRKLFRDSLHAALSLVEIQDMVAGLGFEQDTVTATSDRHWTWAAVKRL